LNSYYGTKALTSIDDWKPVVGEKNWVKSRSAYELAHAWGAVTGFPDSVARALSDTEFAELTVQHGVVEMPVYLDTLKAPSMTDLMLYCDSPTGGPVVVGVEAKATERFDEPVAKWALTNSQVAPTKAARLAFLSEGLGIEISAESPIRYQLLHRTYSVISEARRVAATRGIVLFHSFSDANAQNWEDFKIFADFLGVRDVEKERLMRWHRNEPEIYFLWVEDQISQ